MNKSMLALAVTAALGTTATNAQAYEFRVNDDTTFAVYGDLQYIYLAQEAASGGTGSESRSLLTDNGSTLGFEGEHEWSNGLTGYFRLEYEFLADEKSGSGVTFTDGAGDTVTVGDDSGVQATDEVFVGVKGDFGAVRIGTWDGIYEDRIADPLNPFEATGTTEATGVGEPGDAIAYFSPDYGGFGFAVQGFFKGDGEGNDYDGDGQPDSAQAFAAVASYAAGIVTVNLGYTDQGFEAGAGSNVGLTSIFDLAPLTLTAKVAQVGEDDGQGDSGATLYGLLAGYDHGAGSVIAAVQQIEPDAEGADGRTELLFNANYTIAENLYVYGEVGQLDFEDNVGDYTAIGAVYSF